MKVATERFGEIEVNAENIITFLNGMVGFEEYTKYVLIPADKQQETPFFFLQSVEKGELCFFVLHTLAFFQDYDIEIDDTTVQELDIKEPQDAQVMTMITVKGSLKEATTNLKAPLIINIPQKKGKQIVLEKSENQIKQPLFAPEPQEAQAGTKG